MIQWDKNAIDLQTGNGGRLVPPPGMEVAEEQCRAWVRFRIPSSPAEAVAMTLKAVGVLDGVYDPDGDVMVEIQDETAILSVAID